MIRSAIFDISHLPHTSNLLIIDIGQLSLQHCMETQMETFDGLEAKNVNNLTLQHITEGILCSSDFQVSMII